MNVYNGCERMQKRIFLLFFFVIIVLVGCSNETKEDSSKTENQIELTIAAAASVTDALENIKEVFEQEHNVNITYTFLGSGKLAQQIEHGAPIDVFLSADEAWMDYLQKEQLIIPETRRDIVGNSLVLITHRDRDFSYATIFELHADDFTTLTIGHPESVPAGSYANAVLHQLADWEKIEEKLVYAQDVRQVLTYVTTENADIGIVYETDVYDVEDVKIVTTIDSSLHEPIIYPAAVVADSKEKQAAQTFLEFLLSAEAQAIFTEHGFLHPPINE